MIFLGFCSSVIVVMDFLITGPRLLSSNDRRLDWHWLQTRVGAFYHQLFRRAKGCNIGPSATRISFSLCRIISAAAIFSEPLPLAKIAARKDCRSQRMREGRASEFSACLAT